MSKKYDNPLHSLDLREHASADTNNGSLTLEQEPTTGPNNIELGSGMRNGSTQSTLLVSLIASTTSMLRVSEAWIETTGLAVDTRPRTVAPLAEAKAQATNSQ